MKYSKELAVGVSLAAAAVIFILGVRFLEDVPLFRSTYELHTTFENVDGLTAGTSVRVSGVHVGSVKSVELDPASENVRVRFQLDEAVRVPEGSYATIGGIAALASLHMTLHLGPPGNEAVPPGTLIPGRDQEDLLATISERGPAVASQLDRVLTNANAALEGADMLLQGAEGNVTPALEALREASETLSATLRSEQESIRRTIRNMESFSAGMADISETGSDTLAEALNGLNRSMQRLDRSLTTLDGTTKSLDEILLKVNSGEGTLGLLVNDPTLYHRMDSTMASVHAILEEARRDPEKYLKHMSIVDLF